MYKKILYKKAYRSLEGSTPLKYDCGMLCGKKCCSGDKDAGMHLYPGEETLLSQKHDFLVVRKDFFNDNEISFAVCNGNCDRRYRPLACRIYPLVPYIDDKGRLNIIEDPRARYICPLLLNLKEIRIERSFFRRITEVFRLLTQDTEIKAYITALSSVLVEYSKFMGTLNQL
jgi:hypothetical protein